nr:hypothetical protein BaRGS_008848 [Batillaria attramentaria]
MKPLKQNFMVKSLHSRVTLSTAVSDGNKEEKFSVHFTSDETESFSGFKLLFSFHNHTAVPQRLSEGTWNCSVPYFSNFQQHFRCDLDQDCAGAEDETDCPYTSHVTHEFLSCDMESACWGSDFWSAGICRDETHFQCPGDGYCLPAYVHCNGVYDCPGKEDEAACDSYTCPGYYRCRSSRICVHPDNMCDGVFQCPQRDDELLCDLRCPENCTCYGNLGSFVYRAFISRVESTTGFRVFVTHLSVSDFVMGVYLAVIGVADRVFQGTYLWKDLTWKRSVACQLAGFLCLLSSEVSAFLICLITLDRFLVLRFPFSQLHFRGKSAHLLCVLVWFVGFVLASVPLLPVTSHWEFYSQTGICIPLPITRKDFPGHTYSFTIMIIFNFILFLLIAAGQVTIFWSVRANSMPMGDVSTSTSKDLTIARRLFTVVMSDFLCWFPIGLLGLLASNDVAVSGEVNVAMAIFVLPFNSVLNPFLYTLNIISERRREANEKRLTERLAKLAKLPT